MNYIHKRRLMLLCLIITSITVTVGLALYALQQNINLFFSPTQVVNGEAPRDHTFRLGGLVAKGSVQHAKNSLAVTFIVTDQKNNVPVEYTGILPDLFREGQAVVVEGRLNPHGGMQAEQVLAKHDERYMPKEVQAILQKGKA